MVLARLRFLSCLLATALVFPFPVRRLCYTAFRYGRTASLL
jgi:hypothetical protein